MLRCLILLRSATISSSRLIIRRSRTLTTIRTYDRMRELTRVGSSSTKPSRCNVRCFKIAGDVLTAEDWSTGGDSSTVAASAKSALGESAVSWLDCARGVGAESLGVAWLALMRAAVLSFFLFAFPLSV